MAIVPNLRLIGKRNSCSPILSLIVLLVHKSDFPGSKRPNKGFSKTSTAPTCAGQDVQGILDTQTDPGPVTEGDTEYAKAMRSLDGHFSHQVNIPFDGKGRLICDEIIPAV